MSFILAMTAREMRASWKRLLFFFICLSIGVGAIVAIRSVIQSVRAVFDGEARSLMSADAIISSNRALSPEVTKKIEDRLRSAGATSIASIELGTMVRPAERPGSARMVELRAVDEGFPFYGELKLEGQRFDYALLRDAGVLVRPELIAQLGRLLGCSRVLGIAGEQILTLQ